MFSELTWPGLRAAENCSPGGRSASDRRRVALLFVMAGERSSAWPRSEVPISDGSWRARPTVVFFGSASQAGGIPSLLRPRRSGLAKDHPGSFADNFHISRRLVPEALVHPSEVRVVNSSRVSKRAIAFGSGEVFTYVFERLDLDHRCFNDAKRRARPVGHDAEIPWRWSALIVASVFPLQRGGRPFCPAEFAGSA